MIYRNCETQVFGKFEFRQRKRKFFFNLFLEQQAGIIYDCREIIAPRLLLTFPRTMARIHRGQGERSSIGASWIDIYFADNVLSLGKEKTRRSFYCHGHGWITPNVEQCFPVFALLRVNLATILTPSRARKIGFPLNDPLFFHVQARKYFVENVYVREIKQRKLCRVKDELTLCRIKYTIQGTFEILSTLRWDTSVTFNEVSSSLGGREIAMQESKGGGLAREKACESKTGKQQWQVIGRR